jgi:hypothetical protein
MPSLHPLGVWARTVQQHGAGGMHHPVRRGGGAADGGRAGAQQQHESQSLGGADGAAALPRVPGAAGPPHLRRAHHRVQPHVPLHVSVAVGGHQLPGVPLHPGAARHLALPGAQHAPSPFPAGSLSYRDAAHHHLRTLERRLHCFNWRHESSTRPVQQLWRFFLALISHPPLSRSLTLQCALYCAWSLSGARRLHTLTGRA